MKNWKFCYRTYVLNNFAKFKMFCSSINSKYQWVTKQCALWSNLKWSNNARRRREFFKFGIILIKFQLNRNSLKFLTGCKFYFYRVGCLSILDGGCIFGAPAPGSPGCPPPLPGCDPNWNLLPSHFFYLLFLILILVKGLVAKIVGENA